MKKIVITVEHLDNENCNIRIEANKVICRKLAYKMTEVLDSNMFRMIDKMFPVKTKGGKNGKN
jgi:hypothetical protein